MSEQVTAFVVTAMEEEARPYLLHQAEEVDTPVGRAWRLEIGGQDSVLLVSGIGLVNAVAAVTSLLTRFTPNGLISSGSAGGLAQGIFVGDVVVGNAYAFHDADATNFGYARGQVPGMPERYEGDKDLVSQALSARIQNVRVRPGKIVSGNSFIYSRTVEAVRAAFPNALAADMESAALAQVAHLFGLRFVSVRAVSDLCGPHAGDDFSMSVAEVSERAAAVVEAVVKRL
ncbi:MAG: 5'-methylthioadenosine/adenosylhomocysteine nucleosidase [Actinomycetota bacterium]